MRRFWLSIFTIICISSSLWAQANEALELNYLKYPPLSWEEDGEVKGIMIDVLNEALHRRMGINLIHQEFPWKRAQRRVREGLADAFSTVPTQERREYTNVSSEPVVVVNVTMFTWAGNPRLEVLQGVKDIPDLKGFEVIDYLGNGWAKKNLVGLSVYWAPKIDNVLQMLSKGRADVFVQNSLVTHYNIKKMSLQDKIVEIPTSLSVVPFSLCVGKKSPYATILNDFDKAMKAMRDDGTLAKIYKKYK